MILQALYALYNRLKDEESYEVAPPGYSLQKITFKVVLRPDGSLFGIQDARVQQRPRPVRVLGAAKSPGSGLNPCFLWDNTGYMLGFKPGDVDPERSKRAFEEFRKDHLERESSVNAPAFSAVCRFLENWSPERAPEFPVLLAIKSGFGVFQLVGEACFLHEDTAIDSWWRARLAQNEVHGPEGQCLLTGTWGPLARLHPMTKGVAGANAQASLVGFNDQAYCSYGKQQTFNAPVSEDAALAYGAALNALLDGPMRSKHRMRLGDTTVAFWTEKPSLAEDIFAQFAEHGAEPTPEAVQDEGLLHKLEIFLTALREGVEKYGEVDEHPEQMRFYMLGLSPNQGRLAVRFFLQGNVHELLDNLRGHYRDMRIEPKWDADTERPDPEFPSTWMLLSQAAREAKEMPPILAGPLLRSVITGARYPDGLYSAVLRRIRADRDVNYFRASIIKGWLVRNHKQEVTMSLDLERTDPAYRLGRLFAVLERLQERAFYEQTGRNLEKGIRDSFFSAACATPASVFPRLERLSTHHRRQLSGYQKHYFDQLIADIKDSQTDTPSVLSLKGQGVFLLGYYHQWKPLHAKKQAESDKEE